MGIRLKALREAAGLSQARLAYLAGVHLRSVQSWEYAKRTMSLETAVKVAAALCVTLDKLAGVEPVPAAAKKRGE
jgi:transcriptional regulator with XRE-family HTH domain